MCNPSRQPGNSDPDRLSIAPNGALGPNVAAIVLRASCGDLDCQRYLFQDRLDALRNPDTANANAMLIAMEAVLFGRLIASRGAPDDVRRLAGALCQASVAFHEGGRHDIGNYLIAEAVSILEQLAECGDDLAAVSSHELITDQPVELLDQVRALRRRATQDEETA